MRKMNENKTNIYCDTEIQDKESVKLFIKNAKGIE